MARVELAGRHVSAATGGRALDADGPLVVLLHGAGMDRTVWSLQTRWLAHHGCPAIAVDLPGHGASNDSECTSIVGYAEWLAEALDGADRAIHLVGHSMGSFVALECAARRQVASIVLVGTAAEMPVHPALLEAARNDLTLAAGLMSGWGFAPRSRTGPNPSPGSSMVGGSVALVAQSAPGVLFNDLTMCAAYEDAVATAATLTIPLTFALGELDRMTPVAAAQPLIDAASDAHVHIAPGVGHMLPVESPAFVRTVIATTVSANDD